MRPWIELSTVCAVRIVVLGGGLRMHEEDMIEAAGHEET